MLLVSMSERFKSCLMHYAHPAKHQSSSNEIEGVARLRMLDLNIGKGRQAIKVGTTIRPQATMDTYVYKPAVS